MLRFLCFMELSIFFINASAQVLDTARIKTIKIDTTISVPQQDVADYISLRKIKDTLGKVATHIRIIKSAKETQFMNPKSNLENILHFSAQNEKYQATVRKQVTANDISEFISIRKISGDTTGKTKDYIKLSKLNKKEWP